MHAVELADGDLSPSVLPLEIGGNECPHQHATSAPCMHGAPGRAARGASFALRRAG
jgi:hypothetical protein